MIIECILSHGAKLPKRNNPSDSGMDVEIKGYKMLHKNGSIGGEVWFDEEPPHDHSGMVPLYPNERILALTGIRMSIPKTTQEEQEWAYEIQVRPRSGLALKYGISIVNTPGTIDNNYQGDIGVILINHGSEPFIFNNGDKIAQLVINRVYVGNGFEIVDEFSKETDRGDKGYGSSGK